MQRRPSARVAYQVGNECRQGQQVAGKAGDHRGDYAVGIKHVLVETASGGRGEEGEIGKLRAAIAFPEGVSRIDFGKKRCCALSEIFDCCRLQDRTKQIRRKRPVHFSCQVLRVAEPVPSLAGSNGSLLAGPGIYVLEQVVMNLAVMIIAKVADRQGFFGARQVHGELEFIEFVLVGQVCEIFQYGCASVAQRVDFADIDQLLLELGPDAPAPRIAGFPAFIGDINQPAGLGGANDTFHRTDLFGGLAA